MYAISLARSCSKWLNDCDFYLTVVDCQSEEELNKAIGDEIRDDYGKIKFLTLTDLKLPNVRMFAFQYTAFELVCACKAYAMAALRERGHDRIVYLDADMWIYGDFNQVWKALDSHSILLSPHLIRSLPDDGKNPQETEFLRCGTYNAGFLAIRVDEIGDEFLKWFRKRMERECIVDIRGALFVDQKWLNLVPGLFSSVGLIRDSGFNAGHWTLSQFQITQRTETQQTETLQTDGKFYVGDDKLSLFHFSCFLPDDPYAFQRQQNRIRLSDSKPLQKLVNDYRLELAASKRILPSPVEYGFGKLACGTVIESSWREAIRRRHPSLKMIIDPFDSRSVTDLVLRYQATEQEATQWRADWREVGPKKSKLSKLWKKLRRNTSGWLFR